MNKQDFIRKVTSRKFLIALGTIVSGILMMFGYADTSAETISGAILTIGGAVGYMIAEGIVDGARVSATIDGVVDIIEVIEEENGDKI